MRGGGVIGEGVAPNDGDGYFAILYETAPVQSLVAALRPEPVHHTYRLFGAFIVHARAHAAIQSKSAPHLGFDIGERIIIRVGHGFGNQGDLTWIVLGRWFGIFRHACHPAVVGTFPASFNAVSFQRK